MNTAKHIFRYFRNESTDTQTEYVMYEMDCLGTKQLGGIAICVYGNDFIITRPTHINDIATTILQSPKFNEITKELFHEQLKMALNDLETVKFSL